MDVVYVRSQPGSPPDQQQTTPLAGEVAPHRSWTVSIRVNSQAAVLTTIRDPFSENEYGTVFESYLYSSDRPRWSPQSLSLEKNDGDDLSRVEDRIHEYGRSLVNQLGLENIEFNPGTSECQIHIVQNHQHDFDPSSGGTGAGIHCLAWELIEAVHLIRLPKLRLRVTRVSDLPAPPNSVSSLLSVRAPPQSLSAVQGDPGATFKVLLVVARDFSRRGADRDPEPDLAQWPLMSVQKKLRSRMLLEVVRPGSREELEEHLRVRAEQGLRFNLVHFDLHGRIMPDGQGKEVPWLLFAKRYRANKSGYQAPQTHLARADAVAQLLARHQIGNVVLNACLSAYNRTGPTTNLAHIFMKHGIRNVSAMWFYVHWQTVSTYLETFYDQLLVKNAGFHVAAQRGREAIRHQPTNRTGRVYQDFFLCVNYTRSVQRSTTSVAREPSPAPSTRSQDSSTSNTSIRSHRSGRWRPSTPRLSDSILMGDEPLIRMQLHLLELEYKLMTFRVVYASDLRRANSNLDATMERMVSMWLSTNLIDEVCYYKAKDFAKKRSLLSDTVSPRERRSRVHSGGIGAVRQLLFTRPVRALRQTLHVVRDVDAVVDPGYRADEKDNRDAEERRFHVQEGLQRLARRLHEEEADGEGRRSYLLLLGSQDAQWWRTYLQHLDGEWWLHMPWSFTVHSRYVRDVRLPG
ncbi:TPR repeat-containing protein [Paramyrothecium foliicola]|nr:TPR repeat-containing protein [Paramyrothecium foliicola]